MAKSRINFIEILKISLTLSYHAALVTQNRPLHIYWEAMKVTRAGSKRKLCFGDKEITEQHEAPKSCFFRILKYSRMVFFTFAEV